MFASPPTEQPKKRHFQRGSSEHPGFMFDNLQRTIKYPLFNLPAVSKEVLYIYQKLTKVYMLSAISNFQQFSSVM
jgi:hypothetical protein